MRLILNKNQFHNSKITNFCLENILKGQTSTQGFQGLRSVSIKKISGREHSYFYSFESIFDCNHARAL